MDKATEDMILMSMFLFYQVFWLGYAIYGIKQDIKNNKDLIDGVLFIFATPVLAYLSVPGVPMAIFCAIVVGIPYILLEKYKEKKHETNHPC